MKTIRKHIHFLLNDKPVKLEKVSASTTLLDFLRLERRLRGAKEGCAEGDCGACTLLVGRLIDGDLVYETVNSCIRLMGSLDACHVVTIEHLKREDGSLHPVQQAMVEHHGSQCGFCTPGIVMSLYGLWMSCPSPSVHRVEEALQGNLCRCTGYEPIVKAARAISSDPAHDPLVRERSATKVKLSAMRDGKRVEITDGDDAFIVPASVPDLAEVRRSYPHSTLVAGSTDVGLWVTKHMHNIWPAVFITHLDELHRIEETEQTVTIGACVTYKELMPILMRHYPQLSNYWMRIGGEQVRNMGTIGGNIANGSPIGDTPPLLLALSAQLILRRGEQRRRLAIEDFFIAYGRQDRQEGDFLEAIEVPILSDKDYFRAYKISKRRDEDISAVAAAFRLKLENGLVTEALLAFGGMAATPKRAKAVEQTLVGKAWCEATLEKAVLAIDEDFTPLSDWRASAAYRCLVAKNLLRRFFLETSNNQTDLMLVPNPAVEMT